MSIHFIILLFPIVFHANCGKLPVKNPRNRMFFVWVARVFPWHWRWWRWSMARMGPGLEAAVATKNAASSGPKKIAAAQGGTTWLTWLKRRVWISKIELHQSLSLPTIDSFSGFFAVSFGSVYLVSWVWWGGQAVGNMLSPQGWTLHKSHPLFFFSGMNPLEQLLQTATLLVRGSSSFFRMRRRRGQKSHCDSTINKEKPGDIRESGRCCMSRCGKTWMDDRSTMLRDAEWFLSLTPSSFRCVSPMWQERAAEEAVI